MAKLQRIIDANINRSLEGLRVCEDIVRFLVNEKTLTRSFKTLRHKVSDLARRLETKNLDYLKSRNVKKDLGRKTTKREATRKNIQDVFGANIQRAKESLRVLEEVTKLIDNISAQRFKKLRFKIYELEKKSRTKIKALLHH